MSRKKRTVNGIPITYSKRSEQAKSFQEHWKRNPEPLQMGRDAGKDEDAKNPFPADSEQWRAWNAGYHSIPFDE